MYAYTGECYGRHLVIHLCKGEDILKGIIDKCEELGIRNAIVVSGIGSLRQAVYHRIADIADDPTNEYLTIPGPTELCGLQGLILDGQPHLHISCCNREKAFGGHMEPGCEVQYLAEIGIIELKDANLTRHLDEFGISFIDKR